MNYISQNESYTNHVIFPLLDTTAVETEYHKVPSRCRSQLVTGPGYQHPQTLDFLNCNMSRLVAWGVTNQIAQDMKANTYSIFMPLKTLF